MGHFENQGESRIPPPLAVGAQGYYQSPPSSSPGTFTRLNSVTPRYRVEYKPGWDCHGLPIELKALQSVSGSDKAISAVGLRQLLSSLRLRRRQAAEEVNCAVGNHVRHILAADLFIPSPHLEDKQKTGCYYTFTKDYEIQELGNCFFASSSLELFRDLLAKHCVYRGRSPSTGRPSRTRPSPRRSWSACSFYS